MKPASVCLPALLLAALILAAGCSVDVLPEGRELSTNRNLSDFALTPADLPFHVQHMENESVTAAPGSPLQNNRNILRVYTAGFIDEPAVSATSVYLKQDIIHYQYGTTDAEFAATYNYYRTLNDPQYTVHMQGSPGVGDRSFAFFLYYDKSKDWTNPVTGIVFVKSDIMEILQLRSSSVDITTLTKIAKIAAAKIPGPDVPADKVTTAAISPMQGSENAPVRLTGSSTTRLKTIQIDIDAKDLKTPVDPRTFRYWMYIPQANYDHMTTEKDPGVRILWKKVAGQPDEMLDPGEQMTAEIDLDAIGFPLETKTVNQGMGISIHAPSPLGVGYSCRKLPSFIEPGETYPC